MGREGDSTVPFLMQNLQQKKLYGSLKTLIFSVSLVFLTLLHAITMDLDKYTIIKLHNSFIPPYKSRHGYGIQVYRAHA